MGRFATMLVGIGVGVACLVGRRVVRVCAEQGASCRCNLVVVKDLRMAQVVERILFVDSRRAYWVIGG
jgi:hypothetical protein